MLAATVRVTRELDLAEESVQEAYLTALGSWTADGVPERPGAWLTVAARRIALNVMSRRRTLQRKLPLLIEPEPAEPDPDDDHHFPDDRLRLVFTCCHPSLSREAQVALTLRLVCGVATPDVAHAFLVSAPTMAARLTRAKKKIAAAGIPYAVPRPDELPERLDTALTVVHLLSATGHTAPSGDRLVRDELAERALDLARTLHGLLPGEREAAGLLALLLVHHARRATRTDAAGRLIRLEDQDRSLWDPDAIAEADRLIVAALRAGRPGRFTLQAAIAGLHAQAPSHAQTDWPQILTLYDALLEVWPSPVVALNRAVALAAVDGPAAGLAVVEEIERDGRLAGYRYLPSTRADLLSRLGRDTEAAEAYRAALALSDNDAEREFLAARTTGGDRYGGRVSDRRTIAFFPESAYGPTNNCVGIGDVLRRRGHRVVFIVEESFAGALAEKGFEERLMRLTPPSDAQEDAGQFWKDFIRETAPVFRTSTLEQLESFIAPTFQALIDGARYVDERLTEIIGELEPDVIVEDNVVSFPALPACGRPWVRIASCNPAELKDARVPPTFSGYPAADDSDWGTFRLESMRTHHDMHVAFDQFCRERGAPGLPELEFIHASPWLNLYLYPREADYERAEPLDPTWHNLESSVRATDEPWEPPAELAGGDGPLVYLSLGSLASGDVALMQGLIDSLAGQRAIVSLGPQHEELTLAEGMVGEEFLPQASILPQADVVITHGGNNTVTECMHFGKPMVVLPVFWDQHDNAQRVHETGFGVRLDTYGHDPAELPAAVERLHADAALGERLTAVSRRLNAAPGTGRAAELIEGVARKNARE